MKSQWRVRDKDGCVVESGESGEITYRDGIASTPLPALTMLSGQTLEIDAPTVSGSPGGGGFSSCSAGHVRWHWNGKRWECDDCNYTADAPQFMGGGGRGDINGSAYEGGVYGAGGGSPPIVPNGFGGGGGGKPKADYRNWPREPMHCPTCDCGDKKSGVAP